MEILRKPDGSITFQTMVSVTVPAGTSMLEAEDLLMGKINEAGATLTGHLLTARDASAQPFEREGRRFTAKSKKEVRHVETPYGCAAVSNLFTAIMLRQPFLCKSAYNHSAIRCLYAQDVISLYNWPSPLTQHC